MLNKLAIINLSGKLKIFFLLISFLIIASQTACQSNKKRDKIIIASAGKLKSIDPAQASTFHALQILSALGEPLYKLKPDGSLEPRLASQAPKISKDGLTIDIKLREKVLFHDGTSFNSESMAFSLRRFMRIGTLKYIIGDRILSIETPEKFLLRINLSRPSTSLIGLLTSINLTPVSPNAYAKYKNKFLNNQFIGTGPYKLINFKEEVQSLKPFNLFWGKLPTNKGINFITLNNSSSLFSALKSKEVDILLSTSIDEDHKKALKKMANEGLIQQREGPAMEIGYITFRTNEPPLNKINIRRAIMFSLDRELISKRVSYRLRKPLRSLIPKGIKNNTEELWPKYNPKLARKLFKEEGFCEGTLLTLPFTYRSNVPADKLLSLTWKAQVKKDLSDCIEIKLNGIESTTVYRQLGQGVFPSVMLDWRGAYPDAEAYLSPFLSCNLIENMECKSGEASASGSFWGSKNIQTLLESSDKSFGEKRISQLKQIEEIAVQGAAYLPVWVVSPMAWAQNNLIKPQFDGSGHLKVELIKRKSHE